jgi:hypothetical protein
MGARLRPDTGPDARREGRGQSRAYEKFKEIDLIGAAYADTTDRLIKEIGRIDRAIGVLDKQIYED